MYARELKERFPDAEVRNGEGVLMWAYDVGHLCTAGAEERPVRRVHTYGAQWNVAPMGWETVQFAPWQMAVERAVANVGALWSRLVAWGWGST